MHVQLDAEQLKLLLTVLHAFNDVIKQPRYQALLGESVKSAEKMFGFKFDYLSALNDLNKFSDQSIGILCDEFYDRYDDLINTDFSLFGENHA